MIKTTNPYSGQSAMLTEQEHKLYMDIKSDEVLAEETGNHDYYDNMQKKLDVMAGITAITQLQV